MTWNLEPGVLEMLISSLYPASNTTDTSDIKKQVGSSNNNYVKVDDNPQNAKRSHAAEFAELPQNCSSNGIGSYAAVFTEVYLIYVKLKRQDCIVKHKSSPTCVLSIIDKNFQHAATLKSGPGLRNPEPFADLCGAFGEILVTLSS